MSRGLKILQLVTQKSSTDLLNLPSYETTRGLGSFEQSLACKNWNKCTNNTSATSVSQELLPEHEEHQVIRDTQCVTEISSFSAKSKSTRSKAKRILFEDVHSDSDIFNECDISDDEDRTYRPIDDTSSDSNNSNNSSSSSSTSKFCNKNELTHKLNASSKMAMKSDITSYKHVPTSNPLGTHTKQFFCIFCKKLVRRFARHLLAQHKRENRVIDILRYPIKHFERKRLIAQIRNEGTFLHNTNNECNNGSLIVSRRPNKAKKRSHRAYSPCPYCFGYYISKNLHRHTKSCFRNKKSGCEQGIKAQSRVIQIELDTKHMDLHPSVPRLLSELKNDEVAYTIKHDVLLLRHASYLCKKYGTESQLKHHSRQKLRQLARLLLAVKQIYPEIIDMKDCLQPAHFDKIIAGIQKLCKFNEDNGEFKIPSMATHLGMYLKEITNVQYSQCIIEQDEERKKIVTDFKELISLGYGANISRSARKTLEESKWNKPKLLPITKDIKIFTNHLMNMAEGACNNLKYNFSYVDWRKLIEVTAVIILTFNRKRPGETERILLKNYFNKQSIEENSEQYNSLSTLEKLLCASFKRVEIRGKLGRRVPILLRENHIRYIDTVLKYRKDAGVSDANIYLFGIEGTNFVRITDIIRRESALSGADKPELLRATYLRKQVATTAQVLDLNDNEMQMLADFMGHDIEIHKAHYRTPELILQVARLSKLLIAVDEGDIKNYKDKNLKNLDIEQYLHVTDDTEVNILPNEILLEDGDLDYDDDNERAVDEPTDLDHTNDLLPSTLNDINLKSPEQKHVTPALISNDRNEKKLTKYQSLSPLVEAKPRTLTKRKHFTPVVSNDKYLMTPRKNQHQKISSVATTKKKSPKRKNFRSVTSDDKYIVTPPKKPKIQRTTWRTPEKKIVRNVFHKHLANLTLPSEAEVMRIVQREPGLQRRTAAQVKAWINNQNRKQIQSCNN